MLVERAPHQMDGSPPQKSCAGIIGDGRNRGGSKQENRDEKVTLSDEQIPTAIGQVESGAPVAQVSRRMGVRETTFYL